MAIQEDRIEGQLRRRARKWAYVCLTLCALTFIVFFPFLPFMIVGMLALVILFATGVHHVYSRWVHANRHPIEHE